MTPQSLAGKRVVITRPPHAAGEFASRLRALGAEPVLLPTVSIRPPQDCGPLDHALEYLERYDWVIFTSANAVEHVWERARALGRTPDHTAWPQIAAIGPATAAALSRCGLQAALVSEQHVAEALFDALARATRLAGLRVLLPQSNLARPILADRLRAAGASVDAPVAYETIITDADPSVLAPPPDAITFTSASAVQSFAAQFDSIATLSPGTLIACIGPVTADAARACGLPVHVVADPHTIEGLIAALDTAFAHPPSERISAE